MKILIQFIRSTLIGGILFLLPVAMLLMMLNNVHLMMTKVVAPLSDRLPDLMLGFDGSRLLALVLLVLLCFASGLLVKSALIKRWISRLEDQVLAYLPGYAMLKSLTASAVGEEIDNSLKTVLVQDGDTWKIGFLVEEGEGFSTVFFPDAPRHDSGELKIVPTGSVRKVNISSNKAAKSLNSFGKGAIQWMKSNDEKSVAV